MLSKLSRKWADWLVSNGADEENYEVYIYGAECFLNEIIADIIVFAIAFLIGRPLEMLIWQIFWLPLRVNLGGHHAKSHFMCIFLSTALAVGCVLLIPYVVLVPGIIWFEIGFGLLVSFLVAPVMHPNHPVSAERMQRFKRTGRMICVIEAVAILILFFSGLQWIAHSAALGLASAALLCCVGKLTNGRRLSSVAADS